MAVDREISWVAATWSVMRCGHACFVWRLVSENGLAIFFGDGCGRRHPCHGGDGNLRVSGLFLICGCDPFCRLFSDSYPHRCSHSCRDGVSGLWLRLRRSHLFYETSRVGPLAEQTSLRQHLNRADLTTFNQRLPACQAVFQKSNGNCCKA
jgi:hypothetical protein